jgi:hypothetical protein
MNTINRFTEDLQDFKRLEMLTKQEQEIMVTNVKHFGRLSSTYNNILAISAVGVENERGGGWERLLGDHAVTLNGRTYTYLPRAKTGTNMSGGISYFTFDKTAELAMADHYKYLKLKASNKHARLANLWMTVNDEVADEQDDSETEEEGKFFFYFF